MAGIYNEWNDHSDIDSILMAGIIKILSMN